jgi:two-component system, chemotaxis family, protein-glutamate methylesterase/glutaminase
MNKVNVLVVDDSAFMRKLITNFLEEDHRFELVGTARNGKDAIDKVKELKPDVITMDVEMPVMTGLEALKVIMEDFPVPVVMLSSTTKEGAENTFKAIELGAVDFIAKPSGAISLDLHKVKGDIQDKVFTAARSNLKALRKTTQSVDRSLSIKRPKEEMKTSTNKSFKQDPVFTSTKKILCIGTSTGGPRALHEVLTNLPASINAPILVVQHMPPGFTKSLATRLNSLSAISVKEAEDGEILKKGTAYIAPGGWHLKIKRVGMSVAIKLDQTEQKNGHRPSVDEMFDSVTVLSDYAKIAVVMTGMGSDGANGMKKLKELGNTIAIAESEESSIVYGMPKSAIATKVVDEVVHLEKIASSIMKYIDA